MYLPLKRSYGSLRMFRHAFHSILRRYGVKVRLSTIEWWKDEKCISLLEQYGLSREELGSANNLPQYDFSYIKHAVEVLEESGIVVTRENLLRFKILFQTSTNDLLKKKLFPSKNLTERFVKYLDDFPFEPSLRMPSLPGIAKVYEPQRQYYRRKTEKSVVPDWPLSAPEETNRTIETEQRRVLRQFYVWHLMGDLFSVDKLMYNYSKITGIRSLRSLRKTLDILENQLEMPKDMVLRNFFLLSITPERLEDFIANVKTIGAIPLKNAAKIAPKILAKSCSEINEMEQLMREYNIPDETSSFRVHVLTLKANTVGTRLKLIAEGNMAGFLAHPRVCMLIYYYTKAARRMEELQRHGLNCLSLSVLTANELLYQRFLNEGVDRSTRADQCHFIAHRLGVTEQEVTVVMRKHDFRFHVPLCEVKETTDFLLEQGFPKRLILECVTLVLYPREKVKEALEYIKRNEGLKNWGLAGGFVSSLSNSFGCGSKHLDRRLLLALYFLEKPFHFTGEGAIRSTSRINYALFKVHEQLLQFERILSQLKTKSDHIRYILGFLWQLRDGGLPTENCHPSPYVRGCQFSRTAVRDALYVVSITYLYKSLYNDRNDDSEYL